MKKIILCGLPASGKTSFLAALWHLLFSNEIETSLVQRQLPNNREYLARISEKWNRFSPIDRNFTNDIKEITLFLKRDESIVDLIIPDVSGETWGQIWENRMCPHKLFKRIEDADGFVLFIHSDNIKQAVDISTANEMVGDSDIHEGQINEWSISDTPTSVVLIDILQAIVNISKLKKINKLLVIFSAWDMVEKMGQAPEVFLRSQLPMFYQYILKSQDVAKYCVYGVSAQGGDLTDLMCLKKLEEVACLSERIHVVNHDGSVISHDLTEPISWLIDQEKSPSVEP